MFARMGYAVGSATHFNDAMAFCCKAGYRPKLAWSLCHYADMLRERDGEGDRENAVSLPKECQR